MAAETFSAEKMDSRQLEKLEEGRQFLKAQLFAQPFNLVEGPFSLPDFVGITHWEEVTCLGFHPGSSQLEAVVELRRSSGYSGELCETGSTEYVRFFIDWHDGAGFQDVGLTSFQAFDVAAANPIQHLVRLELDDQARRRCCNRAVLPTVRAVLAWNEVPSLDPDQPPIYGNSMDADIQIAPSNEPLCFLKPKLPDLPLPILDLELQAVPQAFQKPTPLAELIEIYQQKDVGAERMLYPTLAPNLDPEYESLAAWQPDLHLAVEKLNLDLGKVLEQLAFDKGGNTSYEELVCVGLDSDRDTLGAVIHIKRPAGYSGNLCRDGSTEYVRFWADWSDDGTWTPLGTATVPVHDLAKIPGKGLFYAVSLPVSLDEYLQPCDQPRVVRIRAVLSWEKEPTHAERLETWGNRIDAWVRLRPAVISDDDLVAELYRVGGVYIENIDSTTHLAYPSGGILNANDCHRAATDRPFAGNVSVAGRIRDFSGNNDPIYYQVQFSSAAPGSATRVWAPVAHQVTYRLDNPAPIPDATITEHSVDGWFEYQEKLNLGPLSIYVKGEHLATWGTRGMTDGHYEIRVAYTKNYPLSSVGTVYYTTPIAIVVDNTRFVVSELVGQSSVDTTSTFDLVVDGASNDCRRYKKGEVIQGHLRALDRYFHRWTLNLQPAGRTGGTLADPHCRSYAFEGDQGDANQRWSVDTTNMQPCGYTLRLTAFDRAIVDSSGSSRHRADKYIGLVVDP